VAAHVDPVPAQRRASRSSSRSAVSDSVGRLSGHSGGSASSDRSTCAHLLRPLTLRGHETLHGAATIAGVIADRDPHAGMARRIWTASVASAALTVAAFAWEMLWLQPRLDAGAIAVPASFLLILAPLPVFWLAQGLLAAPEHSPPAFRVRRGRFVAPAAPKLRAQLTALALATWGFVPLAAASARRVAPELPLEWAAGCLGVLTLAVTVAAARSWHRTVVLTPAGLTVRTILDTPVVVPWDRAFPGYAADRPDLRAVEPGFLARAIEHYHDHPEYRPAIGTAPEHARLIAVLHRPAESGTPEPAGE
jgi:hypothetical protein